MNKKKRVNKGLLVVFILGIVVLVIAEATYLIPKINFKKNTDTETELEGVFNIYKIHYYSDIGVTSAETTYQNPEWKLEFYQYTDIAIYLDRIEEYNSNNCIKSIYIDNIQISNTNKGNQKIYYLNPLDFGNGDVSSLLEEDEITDTLKYNIMNDENEENDIGYSIPIFFEDCSNPITLRYVNYDILTDYKISGTEQISFDGTLLRNAGINLSDIEANGSLDLTIVTSDNEKHTVTLNFEIPLTDGQTEIYDEAINITEDNLENNF